MQSKRLIPDGSEMRPRPQGPNRGRPVTPFFRLLTDEQEPETLRVALELERLGSLCRCSADLDLKAVGEMSGGLREEEKEEEEKEEEAPRCSGIRTGKKMRTNSEKTKRKKET